MDERLLMAVQACATPTLWISHAPTANLGELTVTLKTSRHGTDSTRRRALAHMQIAPRTIEWLTS